ncbi:MAG: hypothetical protein Q3998_03760 [Porphyromonas sp.]|nr:hypothetical protein [Porphyromonas sp.]
MNATKLIKHFSLVVLAILPILFVSCDVNNQTPDREQLLLRNYVWQGTATHEKSSGDVTLVFMSGDLTKLNPKTTIKVGNDSKANDNVEEGVVYITYKKRLTWERKGTYRFQNGALSIITYHDIDKEPWLKKWEEFVFIKKEWTKNDLYLVNINTDAEILKELTLSPVSQE